MYAIAFDLDTNVLRQQYHVPSWNNAYVDIRTRLEARGFRWQQQTLYFGGANTDAVACVLAVIELAASLPWFGPSVTDIRMLRIEELNDLRPAVQQGAHHPAPVAVAPV